MTHQESENWDIRKELSDFIDTSEADGMWTKPDQVSSCYRAVSWNIKQQRWRASVFVDKKSISLGVFDSETDAALAYNAAVITHKLPIKRLNKIGA